MEPLYYIDRKTKSVHQEQVEGGWSLSILYGRRWITKLVGKRLAKWIAHLPWVSKAYGLLQAAPWTRRKVRRFVKTHGIPASGWEKPLDQYRSFRDFFTRKLAPESRPIDHNPHHAVIPADGRYLFYPTIDESLSFNIKGMRFSVACFLADPELARQYRGGSLVIARLCPSDYHRFHLPFDCGVKSIKTIGGALYSVNPLATRELPWIYWRNKRTITLLESPEFGEVIYAEIGATFVGSIQQSVLCGESYKKGDEKGFFEIGGSCVVLIFQKGKISFCNDLIKASHEGLEILCSMGETMGRRTP